MAILNQMENQRYIFTRINNNMTKLFSILIFFSIGYCQSLVPNDSVNIFKDSIVEDFSAIDKKGNAISFVNDILSDKSAIVLVFFRGFW